MVVDSANAVVSSREMQKAASLDAPKILINILAVFIGDPRQTESGLDTYQNAIKNSLCHSQENSLPSHPSFKPQNKTWKPERIELRRMFVCAISI